MSDKETQIWIDGYKKACYRLQESLSEISESTSVAEVQNHLLQELAQMMQNPTEFMPLLTLVKSANTKEI